MKLSIVFLSLVIPCVTAVLAEDLAELKPLMTVPDQVVLQDDFSQPGPFNKKHWGARQGTQWKVEEGVLRGRPSTPEYQAKKKDHFGYEPRISAPITPSPFMAKFSVRFTGGSETNIVPFVEFGHHVCRLRLSADGLELLADGETVRVAQVKEFKPEPGKWLHFLVEMKGDEVVIQIAGGPTLHARHECFAKAVASGGNGLGFAGPKGGMVEIDDVTLSTVKAEELPTWKARRAAFPPFTPLEVKAKKAK